MLWSINDRGFLPTTDPIQFLPIQKFEDTELIYTWENLSENIAPFLKDKCLREEVIHTIRKSDHAYYFGFLDGLGGQAAYERAFFMLAYFSTAYVNSKEGYRKKKLPKELSIPLSRAAHLVGRNPILDYTSFCLYNWKRKNAEAITTENIDILLTFTGSDEEKSLLSTFVEFEFGANEIFHSITLVGVYEFLCRYNALLETARKQSAELIDELGHYLYNFENLIYENWKPDPTTYSCNFFFQSPTLHLLYRLLDINFKNDYFTGRFSMPAEHVTMITHNRPARTRQDSKLYKDTLAELIKLNELLVVNESDLSLSRNINEEINALL